MIRVLHVFGGQTEGGVASVVYNYYKHIDCHRIQFDIALIEGEPGFLGREMEHDGVSFYRLPMISQGIREYESAFRIIVQSGEYDIVHVHSGMTAFVTLRIARKCGVKGRIAHCHTAQRLGNIKGTVLFFVSCILNPIYANYLIACGKLAGERQFGKLNMMRKHAIILPNAIDTRKYAYDSLTRDKIRNALGFERKFIMGMVGRLEKEKNCLFGLEVMKHLRSYMPNAAMIIIGDGSDMVRLNEYIHKEGMADCVKLLGQRNDVHQLYSCIDVLVLPSLYEGFPVVAIEAMSSGLPMLLSSNITWELSFGEAVHYLPIESAEDWARYIVQHTDESTAERRIKRQSEAREHGYDINDTAQTLERVYASIIANK